MFSKETTIVSVGDFVDVYHKIKQRGIGKILSVFHLNSNKRISGKWNAYTTSSDFWIIPHVVQHWNKAISGSPNISYETYVSKKYLADRTGLRMLSVGCGEGEHERNFAGFGNFFEIIGVDLSEERIKKAIEKAKNESLPITYFTEDFRKLNFQDASFDVILFNASLHHFEDLHNFIEKDIKPLLADKGLLVLNEYCGPNRLQWTNKQLSVANDLLKELPEKYTLLTDGKSVKKKVYRPGLLRMLLVDPSEAPDSVNLLPAVHSNFATLEEVDLGGNILHILLKGIAHNFLKENEETAKLLKKLIEADELFINQNRQSDAIFGVYQKK